MFLVMLNALRLVRPILEVALERVLEDPVRNTGDLRHLEAACGVFKEDANALVAMLIARDVDEDMVTQAEELFRTFEQIEAHIAAVIETGRGEPAV